ncbi:MAG: hypothetical protein P8M30_01130 [Planctomycetaceae bacterium]|nr:hypothetical protein [Planctomycetaceae bacterium]
MGQYPLDWASNGSFSMTREETRCKKFTLDSPESSPDGTVCNDLQFDLPHFFLNPA